MEKIVSLEPAHDLRNPDPSKNCGVHGVNLRFVLKGEAGAVQFLLYTNWYLPHVQEEFIYKAQAKPDYIRKFFVPQPADLGYHSKTPRYDGQEPISDTCTYLDGKPCYYDGSGLAADRIYKVLLEEGDPGVWRELEEYYNDIFGGNGNG